MLYTDLSFSNMELSLGSGWFVAWILNESPRRYLAMVLVMMLRLMATCNDEFAIRSK